MSNFPLWAWGGTWGKVKIKKPEISTPCIYLIGLLKMKSVAFNLDYTVDSLGVFMSLVFFFPDQAPRTITSISLRMGPSISFLLFAL